MLGYSGAVPIMRFSNTVPTTPIAIQSQNNIKKNGKLYVQITVNHSHWITGMSIKDIKKI
ncbi:hypothetical protein ACVNPX_04280 [Staphylococcus aureus]